MCAAFGAPALASFIALGAACFAAYGHDFLQEAFLFHATRRDPRHNFSPHFLVTYLDTAAAADITGAPALTASLSVGRSATACMISALLAAAAVFWDDLPAAWTVSTIAFVALNRVCTAQYFVWYLGLLPLLLPALLQRWSWLQTTAAASWVTTQLAWLAVAYQLEFEVRPYPPYMRHATGQREGEGPGWAGEHVRGASKRG